MLELVNNLAWLLATCHDEKYRNPQRAIQFAERACKLTNYSDPAILDTMAAAYACAGNFSQAVVFSQKAVALIQSSDGKKLKKDFSDRLLLFKANKPYIEPPFKKP